MSIKIRKTKEKKDKESSLASEKIPMGTLIIHGVKYQTILTKKFLDRKNWVQPDEKNVYSVIPGTVREIYLKPGDKVKKGDKLLLLEAMKMMNNIACPVDGMVKNIHVEIGKTVPKGFLMVEFE